MNKKISLLFTGLNTIDMQFFVEGYPESNTKIKAHDNDISAGGPATNAAIIASILGANTLLITPIGKHSLTRFITDDITERGVQLFDPIDELISKPIFASIITDQINGERTIFSYFPKQEYSEILNELNIKNLKQYKMALFDGFYPDLAIPLAQKCKELGIKTVLDGGSWKPGMEELLQFIDIAICSNDFHPPEIREKESIFKLLSSFNVSEIAITNGAYPILFNNNNNIEEITVPVVNVIDSLGAGDFFHGSFCYYYAQNNSFKDALIKASVIAGESCKFKGTRTWLKQSKYLNQTKY